VPVDVVAIMEALAEQGVTVLFKADAERMAERGVGVHVNVPSHVRMNVLTS
jgi:hypothetical protein